MQIVKFIFVFLLFSQSLFPNNENTRRFIINTWGKSDPNFRQHEKSVLISISQKNCLGCIYPTTSFLIQHVKKYDNINTFIICETELLGEIEAIKKKYTDCNFIEDNNSLLSENFPILSFPSVIIVDDKGKILLNKEISSKGFENLKKEIDKILNLEIKSVKSNRFVKVCALQESDTNKINSPASVQFCLPDTTIIIFDKGLDLICKNNILTGKLVSCLSNTDTIYNQFIRNEKEKNDFEDIKKDRTQLTDFLILSKGTTSDLIVKTIIGSHKIITPAQFSNLKVDSVLSIDAAYYSILVNHDGTFKINKRIDLDMNYCFERTDHCYSFENILIAPINNLYVLNNKKTSYDSIYLLTSIDRNTGKCELKLPIKEVFNSDTKYNTPNIFTSFYEGILLYYDNNNEILFRYDIKKNLINQAKSIVYDSSKFGPYDIYIDSSKILFLCTSEKNDTINMITLNRDWEIIRNDIFTNEIKNLLEISFIGYFNKELYFLVKSEAERWGIYKIPKES